MKRPIIQTFLKMIIEALAVAAAAAIIVLIIGSVKKWDNPITYSNAFFVAGCLVIIAGTSTRAAAGQEWGMYQRMSTANYRAMNPTDRANYVVKASASYRLVILGVLGGLFLWLVSALLTIPAS